MVETKKTTFSSMAAIYLAGAALVLGAFGASPAVAASGTDFVFTTPATYSSTSDSDHRSKPKPTKPPTTSPAGTVALGAASTFGAFGGGAGITNQGILTVIKGDIGTTGVATMITGFHDKTAKVFTETPLNIGKVTGTIYAAPPAPGSLASLAVATKAAADAQIAFDKLSPGLLPGGTDPYAGLLGGKTVPPGVYKSASGTFQITGSDLYLDGQGNPNAVWVFQMATSLTVGDTAPRSVILLNGAQAKNVFWQVGSAATINGAGGGTMVGTIIAYSGATFSTAGNVAITTLNGRALALHASVTMVNTRINVPAP